MCNDFPDYGRCRPLGVSVRPSGQITNPPERAQSYLFLLCYERFAYYKNK